MDIIKQAHDKVFKETYGELEVAREFLNTKLPKEILEIVDLNTLEPQKDSNINKELKEFFSDLLFKVSINNREGYFYLLFEHKSYKDRLTIFQILRYMLEIWESKIAKEKENKLPVIIPLVIYHEKNEWDIKTSIGEMIEGYEDLPKEIKTYIPNYKYILHDLTRYRKEDIEITSILGVVDKLLANVRYASKETLMSILVEAVEVLYKMYEKDTTMYYLETALRYILSIREDLTKEDTIKEIGKISEEGSYIIMTLAEKWIEEGRVDGIEKGIEKGIDIGRQEERRKLAKELLLDGLDIEKVAKLTKLSEEEVKDIRTEITN